MRLNGRAEIMRYLSIRNRQTWFRYRKLGMPISNGPHTQAWALTEELDAWSAARVTRRGGAQAAAERVAKVRGAMLKPKGRGPG